MQLIKASPKFSISYAKPFQKSSKASLINVSVSQRCVKEYQLQEVVFKLLSVLSLFSASVSTSESKLLDENQKFFFLKIR